VFLVPGRPPMGRSEFAAAAKTQAQGAAPRIDGASEIREIKVLGDWAFMWTRLTVVVTPPGGDSSATRAGHTLSILRREHGTWVVARDANMLASVPPQAGGATAYIYRKPRQSAHAGQETNPA